jgi:ribonuclease D
MTEPDFTWIDNPSQLKDLGKALEDAPWVALDTESNSMFVYRERICLMQINAGGRLFVLDTLALPYQADTYAPIKPSLEDPNKPTYVHGGEYDVGCLKRDFAIALAGVWDSQQAASFLGWEKTGYGAVVEKICGVTLDKAYTQYDWATRPLDPNALRYAIDDIVHLPRVATELQEAVRAADLEEEVGIANNAVMGTSWSGGFDPEGFWRIKGMRDIQPRSLRLLRALYAWRDKIASSVDKPPGRMLNNEVLLALCRTAPTNYQGLKRIGMKSWFLAQFGDELLNMLKDNQHYNGPIPERARGRDVDEAEQQRETRLKDWRRSEAENRKVPLQVVLPAKALEYLKQHGAKHLDAVPQLGAKRLARYGDKLRQLCG